MADSFIQLPPDGAGKKLHTEELPNGLHNQVMTLGDPHNEDRYQYVDEYGSAYVRFAEGNQIFDGFGKTKVSQETLVGEYVPTYDDLHDYIWSDIVGAGSSSVHLPNESSVLLTTGTASGDYVKRTTHKYHKYFPGTSQLCEFTLVVGDTGKPGVVRRWGYYDDNDGIILSMTGTSFEIIMRSSVSGTPVDITIPQASFNKDKADGTGISGLTIDPSKANIYWIDVQWLGAGRVRIGGYHPDGARVVFHEIQNANTNTGVYMASASLPLRWEQFNTEAVGFASTMKVLNAAVYTETAGVDFREKCWSTVDIGSAIAYQTTNASSAFFSSVSLRPKTLYHAKRNKVAGIPKGINLQTDKAVQVMVMKNILTSGAETWDDLGIESGFEKSDDVVMTGNGEPMFCTVVSSGIHNIDLTSAFSYYDSYMRLQANGTTQDTYSVVVRSLDGTSASIYVGFRWSEIIM